MEGEGGRAVGDEDVRDEGEDATTMFDILPSSLYVFLSRFTAPALTIYCTQTFFPSTHPSKTITLRLCFVLVFRAPPADSSELLEGSLDERSRGSEFVSDLVHTRPLFLICFAWKHICHRAAIEFLCE